MAALGAPVTYATDVRRMMIIASAAATIFLAGMGTMAAFFSYRDFPERLARLETLGGEHSAELNELQQTSTARHRELLVDVRDLRCEITKLRIGEDWRDCYAPQGSDPR
jgi:hypothetical protein